MCVRDSLPERLKCVQKMIAVAGLNCLLTTKDFYFIKKIYDEDNGFYNKKMDSITLEASFNYFEHLDQI